MKKISIKPIGYLDDGKPIMPRRYYQLEWVKKVKGDRMETLVQQATGKIIVFDDSATAYTICPLNNTVH